LFDKVTSHSWSPEFPPTEQFTPSIHGHEGFYYYFCAGPELSVSTVEKLTTIARILKVRLSGGVRERRGTGEWGQGRGRGGDEGKGTDERKARGRRERGEEVCL
jgi:hypothetical protein